VRHGERAKSILTPTESVEQFKGSNASAPKAMKSNSKKSALKKSAAKEALKKKQVA
jgi:hypothetical protein